MRSPLSPAIGRWLWPLLLAGCGSDEGTPPQTRNLPPQVDQVTASPSTQVLPGDVLDLSVEVSDPEGDSISLTWTAVAGDFDAPASASTTFRVPDRLGPLELTLQLADDQGNVADFTLTIVIGYQAVDDADGDGLTWEQGDCNDLDTAIGPEAPELVDGKDNDCNGSVDEGSYVSDDDGDHWSELDGDCNDGDPSIHPTRAEAVDGVDNDCDGLVDESTSIYDDDGDTFSEEAGDCNDARPDVHPGALEVADGADNDCDGTIDEGTVLGDDDADGYTEVAGDCDDADGDVHPGALELSDELDNDCDGLIDEGAPGSDEDGDGVTPAEGDCADTDPRIYPGALELADGLDNDCDTVIDEGTVRGDDDADGLSEVEGDCDDAQITVHPGALEVLDGLDNDCDGLIDEQTDGADSDGDGYTAGGGDCDDSSPMVHPGAAEVADGLDNDCDTLIDEGTVRFDDDNDGFSEVEGDCDDTDADVHPGAPEIDDGRDNDCDGVGDPNQPPVAMADAVNPGSTCEEVLLDGSGSFDPDGDEVRYYYWFVIATPEGSRVNDSWILDAGSSRASFLTDVPGTYALGLIVSDGVSSSDVATVELTVEDRGYNDDPVAEAGEDRSESQTVVCAFAGSSRVCPPCAPLTVTLDGSSSDDPDGDRLFYTWTVSSSTAPSYTLTGADTAAPELELPAPLAEYGRSNTYTLFLKLEVRDCGNERDVDSVLVSYTCTGQ